MKLYIVFSYLISIPIVYTSKMSDIQSQLQEIVPRAAIYKERTRAS